MRPGAAGDDIMQTIIEAFAIPGILGLATIVGIHALSKLFENGSL